MTRLDRRRLFLSKLADLVKLAEIHEIPIVIFALYRTAEEQKKLYDEGKSKCDGTIKRSRHQDWIAADLGILNDERTDILWTSPLYDKLGELAGKLGLTWGGTFTTTSFTDPYHVELPIESVGGTP